MGTPNYISPEQAKGAAEVDIRSDLYSFGCSLYHMLAGSPPFTGSAKIVMVKHLSEEATPLRKLEPDVSEDMARIIAKLMAKEPADRYQSPKDLIGDLDNSYLNPAQQELIARRVRDGAGLIMLGGYHGLGPGGYTGTALGKLLPANLGGRDVGHRDHLVVRPLSTASVGRAVIDVQR